MSKIQPALQDFKTHYERGETQLIYTWISGDLETPVSAYLKLCGHEPYSFLLESVEGGAALGRYSVIGFEPDLIWSCTNGVVQQRNAQSGEVSTHDKPLVSLRQALKDCHIEISPEDLPPMAVSGLFGYLGYDMVRLMEDIPDNNPDDLDIPDSVLIRPRILTIFDNVKNMICLVSPIYAHSNNNAAHADDIYAQTSKYLTQVVNRLHAPIEPVLINHKSTIETPLELSSNTTREQYHATVKKAVDYVHQGEVFQVVPGQRFSVDFDLPSFHLYRSLRKLNPSPFMFHLAFEDFSIVGSSPEILVRVRAGDVTIRPIAGTRKRGANAAEDKALAEDLLSDEKERAEHLMLLDLGRNDVGRVAETGSITITEEFIVEYYSHVMHIVSNVQGRLRKELDIIDALFAGFPAGTVSGAPKVRAMEIIDELENSRRSYYGGAVGYFSGNGEMDSCIALRTALVKDGRVYVQAGGGVVADSDPEFEYQESKNKARAVILAAQTAIEMAG